MAATWAVQVSWSLGCSSSQQWSPCGSSPGRSQHATAVAAAQSSCCTGKWDLKESYRQGANFCFGTFSRQLTLRCREYKQGRPRRRKGVCMSLDLETVSPAWVLGGLALAIAAYRTVVYFQLEYIKASMLSRNVPKGGARVVDIGIKQGRNLYYLPKDTVLVVAFDPKANKGLLDQVGVQAGIPVDVRLRSPADMNLTASSMDAVVSTYTLGELPNAKAVLLEAARVLKPGKPLVFVERKKNTEFLQLIEGTPGFENLQVESVFDIIDPHILGVALKSEAEPASAPSTGSSKEAGQKKKRR